jgi:hypothetical protein
VRLSALILVRQSEGEAKFHIRQPRSNREGAARLTRQFIHDLLSLRSHETSRSSPDFVSHGEGCPAIPICRHILAACLAAIGRQRVEDLLFHKVGPDYRFTLPGMRRSQGDLDLYTTSGRSEPSRPPGMIGSKKPGQVTGPGCHAAQTAKIMIAFKELRQAQRHDARFGSRCESLGFRSGGISSQVRLTTTQ